MMSAAKRAIGRSIEHNEIVFIAATEAIDAELAELCSGWVETVNGAGLPMTEFWGARDDGEEWRVRTTVDA